MLSDIDPSLVLEDSICLECRFLVARILDPTRLNHDEYNTNSGDLPDLEEGDELIFIHVACSLIGCDLNDEVRQCSGFSERTSVLFNTPDYSEDH